MTICTKQIPYSLILSYLILQRNGLFVRITIALIKKRGVSAAGSAFDWQSRGQGFDPPTLHQTEPLEILDSKGFYYVLISIKNNDFKHFSKGSSKPFNSRIYSQQCLL